MLDAKSPHRRNWAPFGHSLFTGPEQMLPTCCAAGPFPRRLLRSGPVSRNGSAWQEGL